MCGRNSNNRYNDSESGGIRETENTVHSPTLQKDAFSEKSEIPKQQCPAKPGWKAAQSRLGNSRVVFWCP
jgi:hypothetical protein